MILITSFKKSLKLSKKEIDKFYSVCVYQPKGFYYKKLPFFDIRWESGTWIRPREFVDAKYPLIAYREELFNLYLERQEQVKEWLSDIEGLTVVLCCWCPYERAAQRQLKEWGSYVCHTEVIRGFLKSVFNVPVFIDTDRYEKMKRLWI